MGLLLQRRPIQTPNDSSRLPLASHGINVVNHEINKTDTKSPWTLQSQKAVILQCFGMILILCYVIVVVFAFRNSRSGTVYSSLSNTPVASNGVQSMQFSDQGGEKTTTKEKRWKKNQSPNTVEESYYVYYDYEEVKNETNEQDRDKVVYYYFYYYSGRTGDKPTVIKKSSDKTSLTGAAANCTGAHKTSTPTNRSISIDTHPDAGVVTISCRIISYRAPLPEIERGGVDIVVGVLSAAGERGPDHRDSIRSTWGRNRKGIYFIVAGPWENIETEFNKYRDLIWIQEEEIYEGEESVLPFKTEGFIYIIHKHSLPGESGYKFLFKTDDDSYVDLKRLEHALLIEQWNEPLNYWGKCTLTQYPPLRDMSLKWAVSFDMYPEQLYPVYCQGAGFALSRNLVRCAVEDGHIEKFRYNPFEDVSVGLLAERCGMVPVSDLRIEQYRSDEGKTNMLASDNLNRLKMLPKATMSAGKILQHRVKTHFDMYSHYLCTLNDC